MAKISKFVDPGRASEGSDLILAEKADGSYLSVPKQTFLSGVTGGGGIWKPITANYSAQAGDRLIVTTAGIEILLPANPVVGDQIEIFLAITSFSIPIRIRFNGRRYQNLDDVVLNATTIGASVTLIFAGVNGWYPIFSRDMEASASSIGFNSLLWLEGSLIDKSPASRNVFTTVTTASVPIATGLDNRPVLRFNGGGTQELQCNPFMDGRTAATIYIVYTHNSGNSNFIRTRQMDDYWRFGDNNGYIGCFRAARLDRYPGAMPATGSHLISLHCDGSTRTYEAFVDAISKGVSGSYTFDPGNLFRICTNDRNFNGDIASLLLYPYWINPTSTYHNDNLNYFKIRYPSLPYVIR